MKFTDKTARSGKIKEIAVNFFDGGKLTSDAGWSPKGCGIVLTFRSLHLTETTWDSFWAKINRFGIPEMKYFGNNTVKT